MRKMFLKKNLGTSLVVQQLRLHASNAGGVAVIPDWGTKFPPAEKHGKKKKKKPLSRAINLLHFLKGRD